jgi:hypothetical protein
MEKYAYQLLEEGQIRLLELLPASDGAPLEGKLTVRFLDGPCLKFAE